MSDYAVLSPLDQQQKVRSSSKQRGKDYLHGRHRKKHRSSSSSASSTISSSSSLSSSSLASSASSKENRMISKSKQPRSILKKSKTVMHSNWTNNEHYYNYKNNIHNHKTKELVQVNDDVSIASNYEMLLFSHMIMHLPPPQQQHHYDGHQHSAATIPAFRCRLCNCTPQSTFYCHSIQDLISCIPFIEQHLAYNCPKKPSWLPSELARTKYTHFAEVDPRQEPYTHLIWKRILVHVIYNNIEHQTEQEQQEAAADAALRKGRVVRFSNQNQELIIPARKRR